MFSQEGGVNVESVLCNWLCAWNALHSGSFSHSLSSSTSLLSFYLIQNPGCPFSEAVLLNSERLIHLSCMECTLSFCVYIWERINWVVSLFVLFYVVSFDLLTFSDTLIKVLAADSIRAPLCHLWEHGILSVLPVLLVLLQHSVNWSHVTWSLHIQCF